jgi:hypothetical protein
MLGENLLGSPRACGECSVCCTVGAVPELKKPPHTRCVFQHESPTGGCTIFGSPERPSVCTLFACAWLRGGGRDQDRPDRIGAMFTVNDIGGGIFSFAIETRPNALRTSAREMALDAARNLPFPTIAVAYGSLPPNDRGDWVIIRDELVEKYHRNVGPLIERLAHDVGMYELVIP